jgi:Bacterial PH domain
VSRRAGDDGVRFTVSMRPIGPSDRVRLRWIGGMVLVLLAVGLTFGSRRFAVFAALVIVPGIAIAVRRPRVGVEARPDCLVVRNWWRTVRLDPGDIARFEVRSSKPAEARYGFGPTVTVVLRSGETLDLHATTRRSPAPLPELTAMAEADRDRLAAWLADGFGPDNGTLLR